MIRRRGSRQQTLAHPARRKRASLRRNGPRVLSCVVILFVGSAFLRLSNLPPDATEAVLHSFAAWAQPDNTSKVEDDGAPETSVDGMLVALLERESALGERERTLDARQRALEIAETQLEQGLAEIQAAEAALRETLALADGAAQEDLDRLTRMYETMKPKDAAALFATMDPVFAAGFLGQMAPAADAEILSGLPPETAYSVSLVLAGRNMRVPAE